MSKLEADRSERVMDLLKRRLPGWKTPTLKQRLRGGLVLRNGKPVQSGAEMIAAGEVLEILAAPPRPAAFLPIGLGEPPLAVLYADDLLLAVDKPAGLLSVATDREKNLTAIHLMREWLQGMERNDKRELHAAHRLDREASGVLLLCRSLAVKRTLAASWRNFEKMYLAVVDGIPNQPEGSIDAPLWEDKGLFVRVAEKGGGEEALTHYRLLRSAGERSLLEVSLGTGRKHQIRAHLAHIGCPIVGDLRYGISKASRLALHARRLRITHPLDGRRVEITAPLPPQFRKMLSGKR
jgi:23S rRNA pseudouridine1911/1915/1917 synthase